MNRKARKTSSAVKSTNGRVRVTLSIPRILWPWFERQRKKPRHAGNRSAYVRSLIAEEMNRHNAKNAAKARHEIKTEKVGAKH